MNQDVNSEKWKSLTTNNIENNFFVTENGYYSILVSDGLGNLSVTQLYVEITKPLYDFDEFYGEDVEGFYGCYLHKEETVKDSLGNIYNNALVLWIKQYTPTFFVYYTGGNYKYIEGDLAAYSSKSTEKQLLIYADDELVYTSDLIEGTSDPIHFKVDIKNARFVKISMKNGTLGINYSEGYILGNTVLYN
jgi:hypothetical protein